MSHPGALATSRRIGHAVWLERRLFEVVGGWVADLDDEAIVLAAAHSRHHAWRADQLATLLSTYAGTTPEQWIEPPDGVDDALAAIAAAAPGAPGILARFAGLLGTLVPWLLAAYDELLAEASPVADAPVIRLVGIVRRDLDADRAAGEALVARLEAAAGGVAHRP